MLNKTNSKKLIAFIMSLFITFSNIMLPLYAEKILYTQDEKETINKKPPVFEEPEFLSYEQAVPQSIDAILYEVLSDPDLSVSGDFIYKRQMGENPQIRAQGENPQIRAHGENPQIRAHGENPQIRAHDEDFAIIVRYTGSEKNVTIPATLGGLPVKKIGRAAFANSDIESFSFESDGGFSRSNLYMNENRIVIEDYAFWGNTSLTSVTLDALVVEIGRWAFAWCENIYTFTINGYVEKIDSVAFYRCDNLHTFTINGNVDRIINSAFTESGIKEFKVTGNIKTIENNVFNRCLNLETVEIYGDIDKIEGGAFSDGVMKSFLVTGSIGSLGPAAFYNNIRLENVVIGGDVANIGGISFYNCISLKNLQVKGDVLAIGSGALYGCGSLENVLFEGAVGVSDGSSFGNTKIKNLKINKRVEEIGLATFHLAEIEKIDFGGDVAIIGQSAFYESNIGEFNIAGNVNYIENNAFTDCRISELKINGNVNTIKSNAFYGAIWLDGVRTEIKKIEFGGDIEFIGQSAFHRSKIYEFNIAGNIGHIGDYAFAESKITAINSKSGTIGYVGAYAFQKSDISDLPNIQGEIADSAFASCDNLTEIVIPDMVSSVGNFAFSNCKNLRSVKLMGDLPRIGTGAFENCESLELVYINANIGSIDESAFKNCNNLKSVIIMGEPPGISESAFDSGGGFVIYSPYNIDNSSGKINFKQLHAVNVTEVLGADSKTYWQPLLDFELYIHYFAPEEAVVGISTSAGEGSVFNFWQSDDVRFDDLRKQQTSFIMPDKAITATPIYDAVVVVLDYNDGTGRTQLIAIKDDEEIELPTLNDDDDFIFKGWFGNESGEGKQRTVISREYLNILMGQIEGQGETQSFSFFNDDGNTSEIGLTFYAKWKLKNIEFGIDNFRFANTYANFPPNYELTGFYRDVLDNMVNEEDEDGNFVDKRWKEVYDKAIDKKWEGVCHAMALVAMLAKTDEIDPKFFGSYRRGYVGSELRDIPLTKNIYDLSAPYKDGQWNNETVNNLLVYYQLSNAKKQNQDLFKKGMEELKDYGYRILAETFKRTSYPVAICIEDRTRVIGYYKNGKPIHPGHTVIGYSPRYDKGEITIRIYDPNRPNNIWDSNDPNREWYELTISSDYSTATFSENYNYKHWSIFSVIIAEDINDAIPNIQQLLVEKGYSSGTDGNILKKEGETKS